MFATDLCKTHTWWSKPKSSSTSYKITTRGTALVPQWMIKDSLKCDEIFVNRVPTLQNICAATIVAHDLDERTDETFRHIWSKMGNTTIDVIRKAYCNNDSRMHECGFHCQYTRFFAKANDVWDWRETHTIKTAFPYAPYDIVFKKDSKDFSHEQLRSGLRPRKPVKRKLSFDSD